MNQPTLTQENKPDPPKHRIKSILLFSGAFIATTILGMVLISNGTVSDIQYKLAYPNENKVNIIQADLQILSYDKQVHEFLDIPEVKNSESFKEFKKEFIVDTLEIQAVEDSQRTIFGDYFTSDGYKKSLKKANLDLTNYGEKAFQHEINERMEFISCKDENNLEKNYVGYNVENEIESGSDVQWVHILNDYACGVK